MSRTAALALAACVGVLGGCPDDRHPATCTGVRLGECGDGDFCVVLDDDPDTGRCIPAEGYRCDDATFEPLCDELRGEPSCARCVVQGPDPDGITVLGCTAASACR